MSSRARGLPSSAWPAPSRSALAPLSCCSVFLLRQGSLVAFGGWRKVPYTAPTTSSPSPEEPTNLRVRPLVVDGQVKDWTTGEIHEITDRTFVARRAVNLYDALPDEAGAHWLWVLGPWLLVDRSSAHISVLHLPDFDPAVSELVWFRDYAAYCGMNTTESISMR